MRRRVKQMLSRVVQHTCGAAVHGPASARWSGVGVILMMHRVVAHKTDCAARNLTITAAYLDRSYNSCAKQGWNSCPCTTFKLE